MKEIKWLKTPGHITFVYKGKSLTIKINSKKYHDAEQLIKARKEEELIKLIYTPDKISSFTKGEFQVNPKEKTITEKATKEKLHPVLAKKLIEFASDGYCYKAFRKFLENLKDNPNKNSAEQLYLFLEANHFPITADGCFLAYKSVKKQCGNRLVDHYSGQFDNSVGKIVKMDRKSCDSDRTVTCSRGLHVAAFQYAHEFRSDSTIIEVKVNPKDVVSVPNDYNNQKMRVCEYYVVKEGQSEIKQSYLSQRYIAGKVKIQTFGIDETMTARQIIDFVKEKTGQLIAISLKDKRSIINKAKKILSEMV